MRDSSTRWLVGVAAAVAALVVLSLGVALLTRPGTEGFPEGTPEGTVQRFLRAMEEDDLRAAYAYLSADLQERCDYRHFRDSTRRFDAEDRRVTLERTEALNGEVEVEVRITEHHLNPPFGTRELSFTARYTLEEEEGGAWRFTDPPWPQSWCPEPVKPAPAGATG